MLSVVKFNITEMGICLKYDALVYDVIMDLFWYHFSVLYFILFFCLFVFLYKYTHTHTHTHICIDIILIVR